MVAISEIKEKIRISKKIPTKEQLLTLKNKKTKMIKVLKDEDFIEAVCLPDHRITLRRSKFVYL